MAGLLAGIILLTVMAGGLITWQWREAVAALQGERKARLERALAQVDVLLRASPAAVPELLATLPVNSPEVAGRLKELWNEPPDPQSRGPRMRAALALLSSDPDAVRGDLVGWMLEVKEPAEMVLVRDSLKPYGADLPADLWKQLEANPDGERRLRLLAALAAFDPGSERWSKAAEQGVEPLLSANPLHLGIWVEALAPVKTNWLTLLAEVFRGRKLPDRREAATSVLVDYAGDNVALLVDLSCEADVKQHSLLYPLLAHRREAVPLLQAEADRQAALDGKNSPQVQEAEKARLAARQASAAATLLRLGVETPAWQMLKHRPDPEARSHLIERLQSRGVGVKQVLGQLEVEKDASVRRALILALGEYGPDQLPPSLRESCTKKLLGWYRTDRDAGLHGAIDWLLRHGKEGPVARPQDWGQKAELEKIDRELATARMPPVAAEPSWWVNSQEQTFTLIPGPVEFLMGSPESEAGRFSDETLHRRRIDRNFALATKLVTVRQFEQFLKAHPEVKHFYKKTYSPEPEGPITAVTWYEGAQYCRWLSEVEGTPEEEMCYPTVEVIEKSKDGGTALKLPSGYLKRKGYRLPTEAEWEYACRAGAVSSRYYGSADPLLFRYAWFLTNGDDRTWPVGQKRPNDLGLLDMHGNLWNWCQDSAIVYPARDDGRAVLDEEAKGDISDRSGRILRGGSFYNTARILRCADRYNNLPSSRYLTSGFRPARTCN